MFQIAVLISGSGSNLQALIDRQSDYGYRIAFVLSNQPDAYGLIRAQQAGIATRIVNHRDFADRESFEQSMILAIDDYRIDLVVLAGFMRILTPTFIHHYEGKLLNIHPSLLPKFKGLHTHQRVLEAGEKIHGATVHFVTAELDGGPLIAQAQVSINDTDNAESLAQRVLMVEHQLYPAVVGAIAQGIVKQSDQAIMIGNQPAPVSLAHLQTQVTRHASL
jgi:phosphoribosylglycinamide formyltransferase-1